jgi:hypothetical protein
MRYLVLIPFLFVVFATKAVFAEQITMICKALFEEPLIYRYTVSKNGKKTVLTRLDAEWKDWEGLSRFEYKPQKIKINQRGAVARQIFEGEVSAVKADAISKLRQWEVQNDEWKQTEKIVKKKPIGVTLKIRDEENSYSEYELKQIIGLPKVGEKVLVHNKFVLDFEFMTRVVSQWFTFKDGRELVPIGVKGHSKSPAVDRRSCEKV